MPWFHAAFASTAYNKTNFKAICHSVQLRLEFVVCINFCRSYWSALKADTDRFEVLLIYGFTTSIFFARAGGHSRA